MQEADQSNPAPSSIEPADQPGFIQRYFIRTRSSNMLVHGIVIQFINPLLSNVRSGFTHDVSGISGDDKFLFCSMLMNWASILGWGLVIFACAKMIAEALRER